MKKIRVIPRLDIKGPNLVKGINLEGLRVLGNPDHFASIYSAESADEIFYMDCVASLYDRNSLNEIINSTAKKTFIPLIVGGGIRTIDDIRRVLNAGADKVSINTAATKNPDFINQAANIFGSSTITINIEAIKQPNGQYEAFIDNGREHTGREVVAWAKEIEERGAGEIVITSVDREGTGEGFDTGLISAITNAVKIPVIAHGGASTIEDSCQMIKGTGVSGVCIASAFHYHLLKQNKLNHEMKTALEGNTTFLNSRRAYDKISTFDLSDFKMEMVRQGIPCRITEESSHVS